MVREWYRRRILLRRPDKCVKSISYRRDSVRGVNFLLIVSLLCVVPVIAQSPNATINGLVLDPSGAAIAGAEIIVVNDATSVQHETTTNSAGIYVVTNLPPGPYRIQVAKIGFKTLIKPDIVLNVQDALAINFTLPIGAVSEIVTVTGGTPLVNTQDAAVSTVVDRQFAENLPMNGRSFQTLIQLTPGVILTPSNQYDSGQFSVNGQRASSNYWMVDGVSANVGVSAAGATPGNGFGGALGSFSVLGGTNSLVSIDAMQEFRIQTSTYAPEFGRTPGAQISIVTRSGRNQFHGTVFEYFRNDVLDANDWFANANHLAKPKERQNDFGGTFSGPILKDKTFFFFSYEGLRLRLPQVTLTDVPDLTARQNAVPAIQPFLNAFPFDPNQPNLGNGIAQFNSSYSNAATLNAYSLRVDHRLGKSWSLFARYNYSPSQLVQRGFASTALSDLSPIRITTQTGTLGATWIVRPTVTNDLRFNYSRTNSSSSSHLDGFGGAVPFGALPFPSPFSTAGSKLNFDLLPLLGGSLLVGRGEQAVQRQVNVVEGLAIQRGAHSLKFGVDFRRMSPMQAPPVYFQAPIFLTVAAAEAGTSLFTVVQSGLEATILFNNLGAYAQDTWRVSPRLTLTYGLRWDVDFAPSSLRGPNFAAVTGFNFNNLSSLALASPGTQPFNTTYGNFAPRLGVAYEISRNQNWQSVFRGGIGIFYDLASSEVGNLFGNSGYPFSARNLNFGGTFPLSPSSAAPPSITPASLASPFETLNALDPHLELPYTLQWNIALEQAFGTQQVLTASYIGASGRRLIQSAFVVSPNPSFGNANLVSSVGTSNYNALQLQFQRRLSHGLQALASYTWSHSLDTGSAGSTRDEANALVPMLNPNASRGPSDFDIRNAFSTAVTYDIPAPNGNAFTKKAFGGWSLQNVIQARSAPPVNVFDGAFSTLNNGLSQVRSDLVPGIPQYLYGSQYPGGRILNNTPNQGGPGCVGPFCPPPTDVNGNPIRQGDLGRNALRGFKAAQWDFAVHRDFPIRESLKLQFRAEMFNVLNHPNFGPPVSDMRSSGFGKSIQMLGQSLNVGNLGGGGFDALYQIGGPRSIQFALKLMF